MQTSSKDRAKELLAGLEAREIADCAASFEYFVFKWARTFDPHDKVNPVKGFPEKDYLRLLAREFQHGPDVIYVAKSRQLMVSWLLAARTVWEILYHPHAWAVFQSKKEEDAAEMIYDTVPSKARASFIMSHLPEWMQVCICVEGDKRITRRYTLDQKTFSYGSIILPNGSRAEALAQGAAQVEGKVPSFLCSDESSLQEEWSQSWAAAMPCLAGGGRAVAVATMRLPSAFGEEIASADDVDPDGEMRGVARFKTRSGGYGLRVHYSADPDKDPKTEIGAEWFATESTKMRGGFHGIDWQQHMEINPQTVCGTKCIPYWDKVVDRVVIDDLPFEQVSLWRVGAGADYGMRLPSVILFMAIDYFGTAYAVDEIVQPGLTVHELPGITKGGIAGLSQLWKRHPLFYKVNGTIQMDPTAQKKDQGGDSAVTSAMDIFRQPENGVFMQPAKIRGTDADDLALNWIHERWAGFEEPDWSPGFFICRRCTGLISMLKKAEYAEWSATAQQSNNLKPKMRATVGMDPFDAFKHWVVGMPQGPTRIKAAAPVGSFDWLRKQVHKQTKALSQARELG